MSDDDKYAAIYRETVLTREARMGEARAAYATTIAEIEQAFASELAEKVVAEMTKAREAVPRMSESVAP